MKISFFGGLSKSRLVSVSNQICSNFFLETAAGGQVGAIYGMPGLSVLTGTETPGTIRGMISIGDYVYGVAGNKIFRSDVTGSNLSFISVIPEGTNTVCMADNGTELAIVDGSNKLYLINLNTLAGSIISLIFLCDRIAFLDGYFVAVARGGRQFFISALLNGASWGPTDFASVEGSTDTLQSVAMVHRQLWFFKRKATEVWYNSGATFPIERVTGVYLEVGIGAIHSPAVIDNTVYWLSNRGHVVRSNEYNPEIVSTREIESIIAELGDYSDAIGSAFGIQGHLFYQLKFPTGGKTLCYDISNNSWLQRTSGQTEMNWTGNAVAMIGEKVLVGDEFGQLCEQTMDCNTDSGLGANIREASSLHTTNEGKMIAYQKMGVDLAMPRTSAVTMMLSLSDDGGYTWDEVGWRTAYPYHWHGLGAAPKRQFKLRCSDDYPVAISDAYFDAEAWNA